MLLKLMKRIALVAVGLFLLVIALTSSHKLRKLPNESAIKNRTPSQSMWKHN